MLSETDSTLFLCDFENTASEAKSDDGTTGSSASVHARVTVFGRGNSTQAYAALLLVPALSMSH